MLFFFSSLMYFIASADKTICVYPPSSSAGWDCTVTINYDGQGDLTQLILQNFSQGKNSYIIKFKGPNQNIPYNISMKEFNESISLEFTYDIYSSNPIVTNFLFNDTLKLAKAKFKGSTYSPITASFLGSSIDAPNTEFVFSGMNINSEMKEATMKNITLEQSTHQFTRINANNVSINIRDNYNAVLKISNVTINSTEFVLSGENPSLSLTGSNNVVIDNQATNNSLLPSLYLTSFKNVTFQGNNFSSTNSIQANGVNRVISKISILPVVITSSSSTFLTIEKNISIKSFIGTGYSSVSLTIETDTQPTARMNVQLDEIKSGCLSPTTSWVDITVGKTSASGSPYSASNVNLIFKPCVGSGGSSTLTINNFTFSGKPFSSIEINADVTGPQTDKTLATLMNKSWNVVTIKSFTQETVDQFSLSFSKSINGFSSKPENSIIKVSSSQNERDYIIKLVASSYTTIPLVFCYGSYTCDGIKLDNLSKISTLVPAAQKMVNLTCSSDLTTPLDLSGLTTQNIIFTISSSSSYFTYQLSSINFGSESLNTHIETLVIQNIKLSGEYSFNVKQLFFTNCKALTSAKLNFNYTDGSVYSDSDSLIQLLPCASSQFPLVIIDHPGSPSSLYNKLNITNSTYSFSNSYDKTEIPRSSLPKLEVNAVFSSSIDYQITFSTKTFDYLKLNFSSRSTRSTPTLNVLLNSLNTVNTAKGLEISCGNIPTTVNLSKASMKSFVKLNGTAIRIVDEGAKADGNLCVCKTTPCNSSCGVDFTQVSYADLNQKITEIKDELISVSIVYDEDEVPVIKMKSLNNKNVIITNHGDNSQTSIKLDSSEGQMAGSNSTITFENIIVSHQAGDSLTIPNLVLKDVTLNETFNKVDLTVDTLESQFSNIVFKSVLIRKSLKLNGEAPKSEHKSVVSFGENATFSCTLPSVIEIEGHNLVLGPGKFDMTKIVPTFSFDVSEFTIVGNNGNINLFKGNFSFQAKSLKKLFINGTWATENSTRFITFIDFSADLFLGSEKIPLSLTYKSLGKTIYLTQSKAEILGAVYLNGGFYNEDLYISSTIQEKSNLTFQKIVSQMSFSANAFHILKSSITTTVVSISSTKQNSIVLSIYYNIDLDGESTFYIVEKFDSQKITEIRAQVNCTVEGLLSDKRIPPFINKEHLLLSVNVENQDTIQKHASMTFSSKSPNGFSAKNFDTKVVNNTLVFYAVNDPLKEPINLYYGDCVYGCNNMVQITDEYLTNMSRYIPFANSTVSILFKNKVTDGLEIDLSTVGGKITYLEMKYGDNSQLTIPTHIGNKVKSLKLDNIVVKNNESDVMEIDNVTCVNGGSFAAGSNLEKVFYIELNEDSVYYALFTDMPNTLNLSLQTSAPDFWFTPKGWMINSSTGNRIEFSAEKMPHICFYTNNGISLVFNVVKGLKEIHEIPITFGPNVKQIQIGYNWDELEKPSNISYKFYGNISTIKMTALSFPFNQWGIQYNGVIGILSRQMPLVVKNEYVLENNKLVFETQDSIIAGEVIFNSLIMKNNSSITLTESSRDNSLIIKSLSVEGKSTILDKAYLNGTVTFTPGSSLTQKVNFDNESVFNFEWQLNSMPSFNTSYNVATLPAKINIVYKGNATTGKGSEFDAFFENEQVLVTGCDCSNWNTVVSFKSDSSPFFASGESLSIGTKCESKKFMLVQTRKIVDDDQGKVTDSDSKSSPYTSIITSSHDDTQSNISISSSTKDDDNVTSITNTKTNTATESSENLTQVAPGQTTDKSDTIIFSEEGNLDESKSGGLPPAAVAGIVIGIIVVVIIVVIALIIIIKRKNHREPSYVNTDLDEDLDDDV
ncbi:hypothetical protein TRFO_10561 [Tritrichomonas foetus]|uniref:Uncharacterized protein n=1 Tax=Tritrichomonas foetus TaxID=1144522 RepID=A0A1J4JDT1_9EUKA|nr:hypothetical protein TRFO_10561 [Tritrichomonas foetus]|eukprot:OHS95412.1 hypothetical protein TRFO_10561 [Tritrichomonas foetus]